MAQGPNKALQGVIVFIELDGSAASSKLTSKLQQHAGCVGASVAPEYSPNVTHVIVTHKQQLTAIKAANDGVAVVNMHWLHDSIMAGTALANIQAYPPYPQLGIPGFSGLQFSITGFTGLMREMMIHEVACTGASVSKTFTLNVTTHLLAADPDAPSEKLVTNKQRQARGQAAAHIVTAAWLCACLDQWQRLPEQEHGVNLTRAGAMEHLALQMAQVQRTGTNISSIPQTQTQPAPAPAPTARPPNAPVLHAGEQPPTAQPTLPSTTQRTLDPTQEINTAPVVHLPGTGTGTGCHISASAHHKMPPLAPSPPHATAAPLTSCSHTEILPCTASLPSTEPVPPPSEPHHSTMSDHQHAHGRSSASGPVSGPFPASVSVIGGSSLPSTVVLGGNESVEGTTIEEGPEEQSPARPHGAKQHQHTHNNNNSHSAMRLASDHAAAPLVHPVHAALATVPTLLHTHTRTPLTAHTPELPPTNTTTAHTAQLTASLEQPPPPPPPLPDAYPPAAHTHHQPQQNSPSHTTNITKPVSTYPADTRNSNPMPTPHPMLPLPSGSAPPLPPPHIQHIPTQHTDQAPPAGITHNTASLQIHSHSSTGARSTAALTHPILSLGSAQPVPESQIGSDVGWQLADQLLQGLMPETRLPAPSPTPAPALAPARAPAPTPTPVLRPPMTTVPITTAAVATVAHATTTPHGLAAGAVVGTAMLVAAQHGSQHSSGCSPTSSPQQPLCAVVGPSAAIPQPQQPQQQQQQQPHPDDGHQNHCAINNRMGAGVRVGGDEDDDGEVVVAVGSQATEAVLGKKAMASPSDVCGVLGMDMDEEDEDEGSLGLGRGGQMGMGVQPEVEVVGQLVADDRGVAVPVCDVQVQEKVCELGWGGEVQDGGEVGNYAQHEEGEGLQVDGAQQIVEVVRGRRASSRMVVKRQQERQKGRRGETAGRGGAGRGRVGKGVGLVQDVSDTHSSSGVVDGVREVGSDVEGESPQGGEGEGKGRESPWGRGPGRGRGSVLGGGGRGRRGRQQEVDQEVGLRGEGPQGRGRLAVDDVGQGVDAHGDDDEGVQEGYGDRQREPQVHQHQEADHIQDVIVPHKSSRKGTIRKPARGGAGTSKGAGTKASGSMAPNAARSSGTKRAGRDHTASIPAPAPISPSAPELVPITSPDRRITRSMSPAPAPPAAQRTGTTPAVRSPPSGRTPSTCGRPIPSLSPGRTTRAATRAATAAPASLSPPGVHAVFKHPSSARKGTRGKAVKSGGKSHGRMRAEEVEVQDEEDEGAQGEGNGRDLNEEEDREETRLKQPAKKRPRARPPRVQRAAVTSPSAGGGDGGGLSPGVVASRPHVSKVSRGKRSGKVESVRKTVGRQVRQKVDRGESSEEDEGGEEEEGERMQVTRPSYNQREGRSSQFQWTGPGGHISGLARDGTIMGSTLAGVAMFAMTCMDDADKMCAARQLKMLKVKHVEGRSWERRITHMLLGGPSHPLSKRSDKQVCAMAAGCWMLDGDRYLRDSVPTRCLQSPQDYELNEGPMVQSGAPRHWREWRDQTGKGAYAGLRVLILGDPPAPLHAEALALLLKAGNGLLVAHARGSNAARVLQGCLAQKSPPNLIVVAPGLPPSLCEAAASSVTCVTPKYLVEWVCQPWTSPLPSELYMFPSDGLPHPALAQLEVARGAVPAEPDMSA